MIEFQIAYLVFLITFTYMVLTKAQMKPTWAGLYTIAYICTFACEKIRTIISSEQVNIRHKLLVWAWDIWNPCDAAAIIFFFIGICLRFYPSSMRVGRLIFSVSSIYWYLRILKFMVVNKNLGPLITIISKMLQSMKYFIVILLAVLLGSGVSSHAILHPNEEPRWSLVLPVFMKPYLMLFGEIPTESVSPICGDSPHMKKCEAGIWFTVFQIGVYLLVVNILLINLLTAQFNAIFNEIRAISHQVWMFQRFAGVKEYKKTPVLPPPLIVLCHIFLFLKYCYCKVCGIRKLHDNAFKLFLDYDDLERLRDFEEECMEGYFQKQETKLHFSNDECIRNIAKRVDNMYQKVEDIKQKESNPTSAIRGAKFGIRKLEDLTNQLLSNLSVIHQSMETNVQDP